MGSVVKAVTKTVSGVVGWVGDTVVDVGEFLYDDIIKPVAGMVEGVVKGALDDPLGTLAVIAAGALCYAPCAAAAKAAVVAVNGGSIEDILISAATTYIGAEAGSFIGDVAGEAVSGALGEAAGSVAGKAITVAAEGAASGVTRAAINTAVFGGDFGENLLMAAATGAVTNGLSSLGGDIIGGGDPVPGLEGELTPTTFLGIELPDMDVSLSDLGIDLPDMNVGLSKLGIELPSFDATDTVNDVFGTTYESVKLELGDLSSGFADLPTTAQNTIAAGASASISTYLLTGELNEDVVGAQMFNAAITSGLTRSLIQNNDDLFAREADGTFTDRGKFLATTLAGTLSGTVGAAFTGSDPSQVLSKALTKSINKGMNDTLKDFGADALEFFDEVTGAKGVIEGAEIVLKKAKTAYESLAQEVNAIGEELSPLQDKFETAREDYFSLADTYDNEILPTLDNFDTARKDALAALNETKRIEPSIYPGQLESDPPGLDAEWNSYNNRVAAAQTKANTTKKTYDDYLNTEVISRYEEVMGARDTTQTLLSELEGAQEPYKAKIEAFMDADAQYVQEQETYKVALQGLVSVNEIVNIALEPVTVAANKSVVEAITQDPEGVAAFNPDEYREMYRLTDEEDPYVHWLASGRNNFINKQLRDAPARNIVDRSVDRYTLNDPTVMATEEGRQSVVEAAVAEGTAAGYPLELLLDMAVESLGAFKNSDGEWDPEVEFTLTRAEGVTDADILEGNVFLDIIRGDAFGDPVELRWAEEVAAGALEWDPFRNTFVTPVVTPDGTGVRDEDGAIDISPRPDTPPRPAREALSDLAALQEAKTLADNSARNADGSIKASAYAPYAGGVQPGEELSGGLITPEGVAYRELQDSIAKKYGSAAMFSGAVTTALTDDAKLQSALSKIDLYPEYGPLTSEDAGLGIEPPSIIITAISSVGSYAGEVLLGSPASAATMEDLGDKAAYEEAKQVLSGFYNEAYFGRNADGDLEFRDPLGDEGEYPAARPEKLAELPPRALVNVLAGGEIELDPTAMENLSSTEQAILRRAFAQAEEYDRQEASLKATGKYTDEEINDKMYAKRVGLSKFLDAGGESLSLYGSAIEILTRGNNTLESPTNPANTSTQQLARAIVDIATAIKPEEFKKTAGEMNEALDGAEGFVETAEVLYAELMDKPGVVLTELILPEVFQLIPPVVAGVFTGGTATGVAAVFGNAGAKRAVREYLSGVGGGVAVATTVGLNGVEVAGDVAGKVWDNTFENLRGRGYSEEEAAREADKFAWGYGVTGGLVGLATNKILPIADLPFRGVNAPGTKELLARIVASSAAEGAEEGVQAHIVNRALHAVDPNARVPEDVGKAAVIGAFVGTGINSPLAVTAAAGSAVDSAVDSVVTPDTGNAVANITLTLNPTAREAYAKTQSEDAGTRAQGETDLQAFFEWDSYFNDSGAVLQDLAQDEGGVYRYEAAAAVLNATNDNAYTTPTELREAYDRLPDGSPVELSDAAVLSLSGERSDANVDSEVRDAANRAYVTDLLLDAGLPTQPEQVTEAVTAAQERFGEDVVFDADVGEALALEYSPPANLADLEASQRELVALVGAARDQSVQLSGAQTAALNALDANTLAQFGEVYDNLSASEKKLAADIVASEGRTFGAMDANQKELVALVGAARDQSIQLSEAQTAAINALDANTQAQFGAVYDNLDASEKKLAADIVASEGRTASQLTNISNQVGRPAQIVTQQDIDAIADLILEGQAANASVTYTDQQRMYDVNNDGVINTNDQTTLQQLMQQQTTGVYADDNLAIDPTNVFADTGVFGAIADQNAKTARQNQQQQRNLQQQQQRNQFNQQLQQVLQPGATTKVTGGGLADIGGFYNPVTASGIFATPKENDMFAAVNPYGSPSNQNSNAEGVLGEINRIMGRSA